MALKVDTSINEFGANKENSVQRLVKCALLVTNSVLSNEKSCNPKFYTICAFALEATYRLAVSTEVRKGRSEMHINKRDTILNT